MTTVALNAKPGGCLGAQPKQSTICGTADMNDTVEIVLSLCQAKTSVRRGTQAAGTRGESSEKWEIKGIPLLNGIRGNISPGPGHRVLTYRSDRSAGISSPAALKRIEVPPKNIHQR